MKGLDGFVKILCEVLSGVLLKGLLCWVLGSGVAPVLGSGFGAWLLYWVLGSGLGSCAGFWVRGWLLCWVLGPALAPKVRHRKSSRL